MLIITSTVQKNSLNLLPGIRTLAHTGQGNDYYNENSDITAPASSYSTSSSTCLSFKNVGLGKSDTLYILHGSHLHTHTHTHSALH